MNDKFSFVFNIDNFFYFPKDTESYIKIFSRRDQWQPNKFKEGYIGLVRIAKVKSEMTVYKSKSNKPETLIQEKEFYVCELKEMKIF